MDLFQLGRRQHGRQSFITLDLVLEAELFQKPDDSLGSGTAQVVNGDHDTTLLGNRMQRPLPCLTSIETYPIGNGSAKLCSFVFLLVLLLLIISSVHGCNNRVILTTSGIQQGFQQSLINMLIEKHVVDYYHSWS